MKLDLSKVEKSLSKKQRAALSVMPKQQSIDYLMTHLGYKRKNRVNIERYVFTGSRVAKVHTKSGDILAMLRTLYNCGAEKRPTDDSEEWLGVEIECFLPRDKFDCDTYCECKCTCDRSCGDCGTERSDFECDSSCRENCECSPEYLPYVRRALQRKGIRNIQVVGDGSLSEDSSDYFGLEIKVLFKRSNPKNLIQVCEWLAANDAMVNETCGLHVHIDYRSLQYESRSVVLEHASKWATAMNALSLMLPASRRNNTYCRDGISFTERYRKVNLTALDKHGTIEIRAHSGTTNYTKIINWIDLLLAVKATEHVSYNGTVRSVLNSIGVLAGTELSRYVYERIGKFNPSAIPEGELVETVASEDSEVA